MTPLSFPRRIHAGAVEFGRGVWSWSLVGSETHACLSMVADVRINGLEALVASTARGGHGEEDVSTAVCGDALDPDQELRLVIWALTCTHADVPVLSQKRFRMLAKQGLYLLDVRMRRWVLMDCLFD